MENPTHPDGVLQTHRTIPFTPDEIYAAFADPGQLAIWWGPQGFTNTFEFFDFTAGGSWKFVMHGPDGANYRNECVFAELDAGKRVVIRHVTQPNFTLTISLVPSKAGTDVRWVQAFDDPKVVSAVRKIAAPGNEQNLDRLHALLRGARKEGKD